MSPLPDKAARLKEGQRLDKLHRSYDSDAELNQPFIILTLGACLIATMGLLANNTAVVIGAMVVAPWIMPLRTGVFAILIGDWPLLGRALRTLAVAVLITTALSLSMGLLAGLRELIGTAGSGYFNSEIHSEILGRAEPTLIDLLIALVAGALATYAKLKESVVSSLAGTAIAVALVPPVCAMGVMAAAGDRVHAAGAGLLFITNLLGILVGGIVMLATLEPYFRERLISSRRTQLPLIVAIGLIVAITIPLYKGSNQMRDDLKQAMTEQRTLQLVSNIQEMIRNDLLNKTLTFGSNESLHVEEDDITFTWRPKDQQAIVNVVVRVTDPNTPSYKQVEDVEKLINRKIGNDLGLKFQLIVQRVQISIIEGSDVLDTTTKNKNIDLLDEDLNLMKEKIKQLEAIYQAAPQELQIKPGTPAREQPEPPSSIKRP